MIYPFVILFLSITYIKASDLTLDGVRHCYQTISGKATCSDDVPVNDNAVVEIVAPSKTFTVDPQKEGNALNFNFCFDEAPPPADAKNKIRLRNICKDGDYYEYSDVAYDTPGAGVAFYGPLTPKYKTALFYGWVSCVKAYILDDAKVELWWENQDFYYKVQEFALDRRWNPATNIFYKSFEENTSYLTEGDPKPEAYLVFKNICYPGDYRVVRGIEGDGTRKRVDYRFFPETIVSLNEI